MKTQIKRCPRCKKNKTLTENSGEIQNVNPFIIKRSYIGIQCESCGWNQKTYEFVDAKTGEKTIV
jgi:C4-type Zn-finger protein